MYGGIDMNFRVWLSDKMFDRRMARQRYKRGFSDSDCWGMCYWLTEVFPEMILHLRDMKNGAPETDYPEFDTLPIEWKETELNKYKVLMEEKGYEYDENSIFTKWYIILTRIAYCLKESGETTDIENEYEEEYNKALWGEDECKTKDEFFEKYFVKQDNGYLLKTNTVDAELQQNYFNKEMEISKYKISMKDEALDLIKNYFYDLWD